jgi:polyisoprenoid-binding protein YceI
MCEETLMTIADVSMLTGDYVLDTAHTRIGFVARHTMATKVRGQFEQYEAAVQLDGDDPTRSNVALTIQAESIQTRNKQRDGQLRGNFLDARSHPVITFASTKVQQAGETTYEVSGDLTIRGVTKPLTMTFELVAAENESWGRYRVRFEGGVTINRRDWGVNWSAAGLLVKEQVTLEFDVALIRRP